MAFSVKRESKTLCRICEAVENLLDITTEEFSHLHYKLHEVAELQSEFTHLFKFICTPCSVTLENAFEFKSKIEQTHRKLVKDLEYENEVESISNFYSKHNSDDDTDDIEEEKPELHFEFIDVKQASKAETEKQKPKSPETVKVSGPRTGSNAEPFLCGMCNKGFPTKILLSLHIEDLHLTDSKGKRQRISLVRKFPCGICKRNFITKEFLTLHIDKYHNDPKSERGLQFKCKDCGMRFTNLMRHKLHAKTHAKKRTFFCYMCSETFEKCSELDDHVDLHFDNVGHDCKVCGSIFKKVTSLRSHMKLHTEEFPFQCPTCLMKFRNRYLLVKHTSGKCPVVGQPAPGPSGNSKKAKC